MFLEGKHGHIRFILTFYTYSTSLLIRYTAQSHGMFSVISRKFRFVFLALVCAECMGIVTLLTNMTVDSSCVLLSFPLVAQNPPKNKKYVKLNRRLCICRIM